LSLLPVWLIASAFTLFFAGSFGWIWLNQRLEAHLRRYHPARALELFPPPDERWNNDEEKSIAIQAAARFRLREFIRSGAAARLNDSKLDQLLVARVWISRSMWSCATVIAAMALFFAFRT
jgi:hypothetical protein